MRNVLMNSLGSNKRPYSKEYSLLLLLSVLIPTQLAGCSIENFLLDLPGKPSRVFKRLVQQYEQHCWNSQLHDAVNMMDADQVKKALENGADVNALDIGQTCFEKVVLWRDMELVNLFLEHGAKVDGFSVSYLKRLGHRQEAALAENIFKNQSQNTDKK